MNRWSSFRKDRGVILQPFFNEKIFPFFSGKANFLRPDDIFREIKQIFLQKTKHVLEKTGRKIRRSDARMTSS